MSRSLRVLLVVLVALLAGRPAIAGPRAVACGDTLVESVVLGADLACGAGNAITIGAAGVTVDLAGHTIDGALTGGIGIVVDGRDGVTIKSGTIRNFATGIRVDGNAAKTKIVGVTVRDCTDGVVANVATGLSVSGSFVRGSSHTGIALNAAVSKAKLDGNGIVFSGFSGIYAAGIDVVLSKNVVQGAGATNQGAGIELDGGARVTVSGNTVATGDGVGIRLFNGATGVTVVKNAVRGNASDGIAVDGAGNAVVTIGGNTVVGNLDAGIRLTNGTGSITIAKNLVAGNATTGLVAVGPSQVTGNTVSDNASDGISVGGGAVVAKNLAIGNASYGINGGIDGGGNKARFNGDSSGNQCAGVACAAR